MAPGVDATFATTAPVESNSLLLSLIHIFIVEQADSVEALNRILHEYGAYIIGRMGLPSQKRGISIISICLLYTSRCV